MSHPPQPRSSKTDGLWLTLPQRNRWHPGRGGWCPPWKFPPSQRHRTRRGGLWALSWRRRSGRPPTRPPSTTWPGRLSIGPGLLRPSKYNCLPCTRWIAKLHVSLFTYRKRPRQSHQGIDLGEFVNHGDLLSPLPVSTPHSGLSWSQILTISFPLLQAEQMQEATQSLTASQEEVQAEGEIAAAFLDSDNNLWNTDLCNMDMQDILSYSDNDVPQYFTSGYKI